MTKLGFETLEKVFKNLNDGAKISKNNFYSCHTYNSGLEQKRHKNLLYLLVKFLEPVTKLGDFHHRFVTKLNNEISIISDPHMYSIVT